jgi:hypothetical protein
MMTEALAKYTALMSCSVLTRAMFVKQNKSNVKMFFKQIKSNVQKQNKSQRLLFFEQHTSNVLKNRTKATLNVL